MIRITTTDRSTGEALTIVPPARKEYVKNGKRHTVEPDVSDVMAVLKARTKLGLRGGVLAA